MIHAYRAEHDPVRLLLDNGRALPLPGTQPWPTASQLVAALAAAGLRGQLGFEIVGLDLPRHDWEEYDHSRDLGTVYLGGDASARHPDARIGRITLYKPGESTLAATLAIRHLLGPVVVVACDDDLEDGGLLVRPDDDSTMLAEVWPWP